VGSSGRGGDSLSTSATRSSILTLEASQGRTLDGDARSIRGQKLSFSVQEKPNLVCPGDLSDAIGTYTQNRGLTAAQAVRVWYLDS